MTRAEKIEQAARGLDALLNREKVVMVTPDVNGTYLQRVAALRAALAAPQEPREDLRELEDLSLAQAHANGYRAGIEAAAKEADAQVDTPEAPDDWDVSWNTSAECLARRIRSLSPVSPPALKETLRSTGFVCQMCGALLVQQGKHGPAYCPKCQPEWAPAPTGGEDEEDIDPCIRCGGCGWESGTDTDPMGGCDRKFGSHKCCSCGGTGLAPKGDK
jgi:hypothetical protein